MLKTKHIDATTGSLIPKILLYTLPILLNSLLQQIYNSVDMMVLGSLASSTEVAAVGASSYTFSFLVNLFVGCSAGVRVLLSRYIGENDPKKVKTTLDTSLILSVAFGVIAAVIGYVSIPWLMQVTKCPEECYDEAVLYLRIYICAAPAVLLMNFSSAILNTAGDTRRTMFIGIGTGLAKVLLNILMCWIIPNKIVAVSLATVMSVLLTTFFNLYYLKRGVGLVRLSFKKLDWSLRYCGKILAQGLPIGLANCLSPLANMMLQAQVNLFGVSATAGNSAASSIDHIAFAVVGALPVACGVFVGQNLGAKKHDRVKKVLWYCLGMEVVLSVTVIALSYLVRDPVLKIILPNDPAGMNFALTKLNCIMPPILFSGITSLLAQFVRSLGYTTVSAAWTIICEVVFRILYVQFIYPHFGTFDVLMLNYAFVYVIGVVGSCVITFVVYRRYLKGKYKRL